MNQLNKASRISPFEIKEKLIELAKGKKEDN